MLDCHLMLKFDNKLIDHYKMKILTIHGIIDRRMLINYVAEPEFVGKILPKPFRPKLYDGKAIVGICLIRLKKINQKVFPILWALVQKMVLTELP